MVAVSREGEEAPGEESPGYGKPSRLAHNALGSGGYVETYGKAPHESGGRQV